MMLRRHADADFTRPINLPSMVGDVPAKFRMPRDKHAGRDVAAAVADIPKRERQVLNVHVFAFDDDFLTGRSMRMRSPACSRICRKVRKSISTPSVSVQDVRRFANSFALQTRQDTLLEKRNLFQIIDEGDCTAGKPGVSDIDQFRRDIVRIAYDGQAAVPAG